MLVTCVECGVRFGHNNYECTALEGKHFCSFLCKNQHRLRKEAEADAIVNEWAKRAELAGKSHVVVDVPLNDVFGSISSFLEDEP